MSESRSDEPEAYASTTASPGPIQLSLDDSIESEFKESHFVGSGGLITPGTEFSDEGGFFKETDESLSINKYDMGSGGYSRYHVPQQVVPQTMAGCTWHTVSPNGGSSSGSASIPGQLLTRGGTSDSIGSHHLQHGPGSAIPVMLSGGGLSNQQDLLQQNNPLTSLIQQMHMAMMMHGSPGSSGNASALVDQAVAVQMTEVLMTTVSGMNQLRSAIGDKVLKEFLSLLLSSEKGAADIMGGKLPSSTGGGSHPQYADNHPTMMQSQQHIAQRSQSNNSSAAYLPVGLLDN